MPFKGFSFVYDKYEFSVFIIILILYGMNKYFLCYFCRLQTVIRHCIKCWTSGLVAGYTYHLSAVQKRLECQLQDKKKELEGIYNMFAL